MVSRHLRQLAATLSDRRLLVSVSLLGAAVAWRGAVNSSWGTQLRPVVQCEAYAETQDSGAAAALADIARTMEQLADSAHTIYARALGRYEGIGGHFYLGSARVQQASIVLFPFDAEARFRLGMLKWTAAGLGEGRVDTTEAKQARKELVCARDLAIRRANRALIAAADSIINLIDYFLEEERFRGR